jgi:hypothetical protein
MSFFVKKERSSLGKLFSQVREEVSETLDKIHGPSCFPKYFYPIAAVTTAASVLSCFPLSSGHIASPDLLLSFEEAALGLWGMESGIRGTTNATVYSANFTSAYCYSALYGIGMLCKAIFPHLVP